MPSIRMKTFFARSKKSVSPVTSTNVIEQELASPASDKMLAAAEPQPRPQTQSPSTTQTGNSQGSWSDTTISQNPPTPTSPSTAKCKKCGLEAVMQSTKPDNRNGNSGRPFLQCPQHGNIRWLDKRGIHADNPICDCGRSSRRNVAGPEKGRKLYFTCAEAECGFWQADKRADGQNWCVVDDNMLELLCRLHLI